MHDINTPPRIYPAQNRHVAFLASVSARCPSLRRLWLFSNHIARMEGLHHCGALRELWLHDNSITTIAGVQSLVHLQVLRHRGPRQ